MLSVIHVVGNVHMDCKTIKCATYYNPHAFMCANVQFVYAEVPADCREGAVFVS